MKGRNHSKQSDLLDLLIGCLRGISCEKSQRNTYARISSLCVTVNLFLITIKGLYASCWCRGRRQPSFSKKTTFRSTCMHARWNANINSGICSAEESSKTSSPTKKQVQLRESKVQCFGILSVHNADRSTVWSNGLINIQLVSTEYPSFMLYRRAWLGTLIIRLD